MTSVPQHIKQQIAKPQPDIDQFIKVITGKAKPTRVHLAELFADQEIMQWITENVLQKKWTLLPTNQSDRRQTSQYFLGLIEYWYRMGYDYVRMSGGLHFPGTVRAAADTAALPHEKRTWAETGQGPVQSWEDFERYSWPQVTDESLWTYQFVAEHLPDGMGLMVCPCSGFFEIPSNIVVGYESLSMMCYDEPDLVDAVFKAVREPMLEMYRRLVKIPQVVGFFSGDDMGFRSGTLFHPDFLKKYCLAPHKELAELAHQHGKIHMLHSCGNLEVIMDDLIDDVRIDAKHSFEDAIIPVEDFYDRYHDRLAVLGGLPVDLLARADEQTVRRRARKILDHCVPAGKYAFGSGNSVTNYCKPENVLAMFDETYQWA